MHGMSGSRRSSRMGSLRRQQPTARLFADARDPDVNSCRWMKKPPIAKRIAVLKAKASGKCDLSREAYIRSLVEMYEAKPGDASMDNPRCDVLKHLPACVPHVE